MDETEIEVGKCYFGGAENYKVLSINRGIVTYQAWTKGAKLNPLRVNVGVKGFAAAVKKVIACPAEA
jgi:hypothetical protein